MMIDNEKNEMQTEEPGAETTAPEEIAPEIPEEGDVGEGNTETEPDTAEPEEPETPTEPVEPDEPEEPTEPEEPDTPEPEPEPEPEPVYPIRYTDEDGTWEDYGNGVKSLVEPSDAWREAHKEDEPEPPPRKPSVWDEIAAAYREGVNSVDE